MPRRSNPLAADQDETVDDLLRTSARSSSAVPIRRLFVQQGAQREPRPGPLSAMLRAHDERGLDLFLLHRAVASSDPWDVTRDGRVWARALGLQDDADLGAAARLRDPGHRCPWRGVDPPPEHWLGRQRAVQVKVSRGRVGIEAFEDEFFAFTVFSRALHRTDVAVTRRRGPRLICDW